MARKQLRIFLTSSCIATVYMSIYARQTKRRGQTDVLILDALALKPSHRELILQAAKLHKYHQVEDFSLENSEEATVVPSFNKHLTRTLKTQPGFKQVYNFLYYFHLKKVNRDHRKKLRKLFDPQFFEMEEVDLIMQPVLHLHLPLRKLFPGAQVRLFEHGIGDYLDLAKKLKPGDLFHCVFDEPFRHFLMRRGRDSFEIYAAVPEDSFEKASRRFTRIFPQLKALRPQAPPKKKVAILAMQSLEEFFIPPAFWDTFIDLCISRIPDPSEVHFLVKPHPRQSAQALEGISLYFTENGYSFEIWDSPAIRSLSLEILFQVWLPYVKYVFSPFSSSVFYLSYLYPSKEIAYYYSLESIYPFTYRTPDLYKNRWTTLQEYIREVFGANAIELPPQSFRTFQAGRLKSK